jgi:hypothetical protein
MKIRNWNTGRCFLALLSLAVFVAGCGGAFQTAGDIAQGRQALFRDDYQGAFGYFVAAEQTDPNYVYGTEFGKAC